MDQAGVPADSKLRRAENIFFPEDIQEIPDSEPSTEKLLPTQAFLTPTFLGGKEWTRRLSHQQRISHPRTPSQSEMSSRRPRTLNLNPKLKVLILRPLTL